jgi:hypothetical protein
MARIESIRLEMGVIAIGDNVAYCMHEGTLSTGKINHILPCEDNELNEFDVDIDGVGLINSKYIFCNVSDLITIHLGGSLN